LAAGRAKERQGKAQGKENEVGGIDKVRAGKGEKDRVMKGRESRKLERRERPPMLELFSQNPR